MCGSIKVENKNPKRDLWSNVVNVTVERREDVRKDVLGAIAEIVKERSMEIY